MLPSIPIFIANFPMRAVDISILVVLLSCLVTGAHIPAGKRSIRKSSNVPTPNVVHSSRFSPGRPSHLNSVDAHGTSSSASLLYHGASPTTMTTSTRTSNSASHVSMSSARAVASKLVSRPTTQNHRRRLGPPVLQLMPQMSQHKFLPHLLR